MPSTPSKLKSGSLRQAGSLKYEEIRADLEPDIGNSTRCSVNAFLKHFLYTILRDDDPKKVKLNEIQKSIEELQLRRYGEDLTINEDTTNNGATSDNVAADLAGTLNSAARIQERANDKDDDTLLGSEKEKQLVQERDALLDQLLADALELVKPVANNSEVIKRLKKFGEAFESGEAARYGPFVSLCNTALLLLASCNSKHHFREKDGLDIQFHCNDPSNIMSSYDGMQDIERKPDVVITSLIASLLAASKKSPKYKFQWSDILGCAEFKVLRKGIPEDGKPWLEVSEVKASPQVREHTIEGVEPPNATEGSGSKRVRDDVSVAENLLSSKRQRQSNGTATPTNSNPVSSASFPENNLNLQVNMIEQSTQQATNDGVERDVSIAENSLPLNNRRQSSAATPTSSKPIPSASVAKKKLNMQANIMEQKTQQAIKGGVQCASYALEMMSYNAGVHHAINLLFMDGHMCIWYYDRQGIIQSDGLSIFGDFSQFLVLLFAFQRFCPEDWGIIRCLNPQFFHGIENQTRVKNEQEPMPEPEVKLNLQQDLSGLWVRNDQDKILTTVEVDMKSFLSHKPHCLSGRATSVVSAKGGDPKKMMVCKIYHPEVERRHEGETLQVVRKIAADNDQTILKHLPSVLFYGDVPGCTTHRIRSMIKRRWKGHRTLRILGLKKLQKITSVDGAHFIKAWLETVICKP
ncbi:hypothetical protein JR316_0008778 [Psilocybe cubensis]|uniref:Fungal-type protein kinase domain-containing protein n=2 Tax=Psilocybe cubensis TaxID=181762 RepID=A0A8H7XYJ1_PSICU|nr:hypothetical protein JR316_0008778 [Psilocybe cubensis]KAH9478325.1 hypothetical protein JR316_0008778 [Psilocybe cubensis]